MKIFINHPKIHRRAQLSNFASLGGLVLLLASVVMPLFLPTWANIAYVLMIAGLGTAMIGIYFANRWVRKPRPEDSLAKALKSFDDQYHLYHYPSLPGDHLLLTPSGVVILETINLAGKFTYHAGRWKEAMNIGRALRYIVEERLGNPIESAKQAEGVLNELFSKELGPDFSVPIKPVVVFTHPAVDLSMEKAPIPVCKIDKLKKQIVINSKRLPPKEYERLASFLKDKTIS